LLFARSGKNQSNFGFLFNSSLDSASTSVYDSSSLLCGPKWGGKVQVLPMKLRAFVLVCTFLLAVTAVPTLLFADSFCESDHSIYQYQPCGTVAGANLFNVNGVGTDGGVIGDFQGYHADFSENVFALVWRNGQMVYQGDPSLLNNQLSEFQTFTLVPANVLQAGDQIEFVVHVTNDPNGDHYFYSSELSKNMDGLNHVWGSNMTANQCDPNRSGPCAFLGFEDLPKGEGSDFDYNDFKMWVYGVDAVAVPEPPIILMLGAPLAFLASKLRNLL
jgi:Domain of unknown function (DUF4114)